MAIVVVLYQSNTTITQQLAAFVAQVTRLLERLDVGLKSIDEADHVDQDWCDRIGLRSPTNYESVSW